MHHVSLVQKSRPLILGKKETHPDLNGRSGGSTEPVTVGGKAERIDNVVMIKGVKMLLIMQVPQHGLRVLSS